MPVYSTTWRNKFLTMHVSSIEEMADVLENSAKSLREMAAAGIKLRDGQDDDYAHLVTEDPVIAEKFELELEEDEEDFDEDDDFDEDEFDDDGKEIKK